MTLEQAIEPMADARRAPLKDQTDVSGARVLIVEARFYDDIPDELLDGAARELKAAGASHDVVTVPGALEIPAAVAIAVDAAAAAGKPYDAASRSAAWCAARPCITTSWRWNPRARLMDLSVARKFPLGNGIITVKTDEQAWARAKRRRTQQGRRRRRAALAMLRIKRRLARG